VVIATGSTPILPAPWRQFGKRVITTDEGKIAGDNAAHVDQVPRRFNRKAAFYVNFCDPNVATVGRARAMGAARGMPRLYADRASGRVLGSEMIAPRGEHLAHLLAWARVREHLRMRLEPGILTR